MNKKTASAVPHLTPRERRVAYLLVRGLQNRNVASLLGISVRTVEVHRLNLMRKLGTHNAAQLVVALLRAGVVTL